MLRPSLLQALSHRSPALKPLATASRSGPIARATMSSASSSRPSTTKTHPKRPVPDDIAPAAKRQHVEEAVPKTSQHAGKQADEDWFKGMIYPRVSTTDAADRMDRAPPLRELEALLADQRAHPLAGGTKGKTVVYWMNIEDMRLEDNRALARASAKAQEDGLPLVVVFALNPGDYRAHDRAHRRIDFVLRNLAALKDQLAALHIPLLTLLHAGPRKALPAALLDLVAAAPLAATHVFANLSYEVDELQRDMAALRLGKERGVEVAFEHDRVVIEPGQVQKKAKGGGPVTVYSPWFRTWAEKVNASPAYLAESPAPAPNARAAFAALVADGALKGLLDVPAEIDGFELEKDDKAMMEKLYPVGHKAALEILERFVTTQPRSSQIGSSSPLADGAAAGSGKGAQASRLSSYAGGRDRADQDSTSRLSPYLTSGVISPRQVLNRVRAHAGTKSLPTDRKDPVGMWVGEVAWRDFYNHILAAFPRVSMGQPYNPKYRGIQWETDPTTFEAWKTGRTGFPIVDAAMRQCASQGWMHNRARMISASFLVKDLLLDWRLGERHFMTMFLDGDLASNNGGWQWVSSVGTDPSPYFRIFSPVSQSAKADPSGDYIRHFVPELRGLKGKALYDPHGSLSPAEFKKLGYPAPIVDHAQARLRALARYKNVGEKPDEADGIDPTPPDVKASAGEDLAKFGFKPAPKGKGKAADKADGPPPLKLAAKGDKAKAKGTLDGFVTKEE